ncbi:tRNA (N6-isopentenyl adenosine(37)-C2)-methylthiotransferase MiaB [Ruminococcus flavefaciens]|uniref:tRNA (N6-isopentenyl adenosine(37)-C2)-methylthiotransferase MiaB n=1 Tax=Ruminococcus flavefaciens TaxID=1265 RepID=UPI0026EB313D|nr:tRNA (N6-isopentenyl adenosine(37)-C2)-methylthiotransferase MiaB [Ruminococcus flavefaciens]MDD7515970.1 tRNA (N6-isopentenyl adenosine(37)-C2)-methylthiotransferase MiaB [Ruminococcus flavefaciens]MDY5691669.1 tRNA (N6-isopentenyl adenosine(37)-C2)-methylthiotransferase MiaB [Ruminococcus flavefaciens]
MKDNTAAIQEIKGLLGENERKAYVRSFGCQLNVSDGEKIKGQLRKMGYTFTEDEHEADLIILNTCAVRESAEDRVFGIVGSMKKLKELNPSLIIGIAGCMTAQEHIAEKIKRSYPQVDIVLGTSAINALPKLLLVALHGARFSADIAEYDDFSEAVEQVRDSSFKASVPIMFGCNNFCTYCIVPYVRGRERSRRPEDIIEEVRGLAESGYKEIMLLGQNVNSYGKDLKDGMSFPQLLRELDKIDGDFIIRFMSSHPKDASRELIDTIFECDKVAKHLHLPVQSGSSDVLKRMNRHYDIEKYLGIVDYIYRRDPDFSLTTDLIVGFPDESREEFEATLDIIKRVRYDNIYSFIYSKRSGTKAAEMPDSTSDEEKGLRMRELLSVQRDISSEHYKRFIGRTMRVLVDDTAKKKQGWLTGKSSEFIIVEFEGDSSLIGQFVDVEITGAMNWAVTGKIKEV